MVNRHRFKAYAKPGSAASTQLIGMQPDLQALTSCRDTDLFSLFQREDAGLHKTITELREMAARYHRNHLLRYQFNVLPFSGSVFFRNFMSAQESWDQLQRRGLLQVLYYFQKLDLIFQIQAIAAFDFEGGCSMLQESCQARPREFQKPRF